MYTTIASHINYPPTTVSTAKSVPQIIIITRQELMSSPPMLELFIIPNETNKHAK